MFIRCLRAIACALFLIGTVVAAQQPVPVAPGLTVGGNPPAEVPDKDSVGYVLGPADQIIIRVLDMPEIPDKPIPVENGGMVSLPLVGRINAAGLTVEQFEAELTERLTLFLHEPQVTVTISEFGSQPVSIFGAVTTPGVVQLRGRRTLYEVLSKAGGPRETAGASIRITRRLENGPVPLPGAVVDPTGQFSTGEVNVMEVLEGKNPAANIEIKPKDVISVSPGTAKMVYVVGDVLRAGGFALGSQRTMSVLGALSLAGGPGRTAKPEKARILRGIPGQPERLQIAVNIKKIIAGKAEDVVLRADDVLVVPTSARKSFTTYVVPATVAAAVAATIYAAAR